MEKEKAPENEKNNDKNKYIECQFMIKSLLISLEYMTYESVSNNHLFTPSYVRELILTEKCDKFLPNSLDLSNIRNEMRNTINKNSISRIENYNENQEDINEVTKIILINRRQHKKILRKSLNYENYVNYNFHKCFTKIV